MFFVIWFRGDVVEIETWCQEEGRIGIRRDWILKDMATDSVIGRAARYDIFSSLDICYFDYGIAVVIHQHDSTNNMGNNTVNVSIGTTTVNTIEMTDAEVIQKKNKHMLSLVMLIAPVFISIL